MSTSPSKIIPIHPAGQLRETKSTCPYCGVGCGVISGQLLTEDYYVFNKLAKGLIGTNNIDTNSRLCMSSAVAGYKQSLGADAPPTCYDDVNYADCIFIVGSNTAFAHPVLFRCIEDAKIANPNLKIIFCDPRRTDTAELADLYLPIQPGTDVMLFNGMLHIMLWEGWLNTDERRAFIDARTNGFDDLKTLVRDCTPELVAQICSINKDDLFTAAKWFATSKATLSLYCQGLNQSTSGTAKNTALINLHLATKQIGKAGAGPFSLTGQPNAMGGREVGGLSNLLSAHRDMTNPAHRLEVETLWGMDKLGLSAVELFEAAADGQVKALWIACTNPMQSHARCEDCAPCAGTRRVCGAARSVCDHRDGSVCRFAFACDDVGRKTWHGDQ
jgi:assimilatory nitrate reductase catalytic subunit